MEHQGIDAVEPRLDQAGDVPIAAELAQQRDGVPEREGRRLGPREAGVAGVQRPPRGTAGLGGGAGELGGPRHPRLVEQVAGRAAQRGVRGGEAGIEQLGRGRRAHAAGIAWRTMSGLKLKNVAMTTSAGTAPIGAARDAKYPSKPITPSAS